MSVHADVRTLVGVFLQCHPSALVAPSLDNPTGVLFANTRREEHDRRVIVVANLGWTLDRRLAAMAAIRSLLLSVNASRCRPVRMSVVLGW